MARGHLIKREIKKMKLGKMIIVDGIPTWIDSSDEPILTTQSGDATLRGHL
jgi:hypothetical protein